jgi:hypothetical protein
MSRMPMPWLESLAPLDRLTVRTEGPAVYGWSFRPVNCGVFHYWNGDECVDARGASNT